MRKKTKKQKKVDRLGILNIYSTFNNTIVTITDLLGNTLSWSSSGNNGFKGSRKGTAFAGQQACITAGKKAHELGLRRVVVKVRGPGPGRESALRSLRVSGLTVLSIEDRTTVQHNGCRPPKQRRI